MLLLLLLDRCRGGRPVEGVSGRDHGRWLLLLLLERRRGRRRGGRRDRGRAGRLAGRLLLVRGAPLVVVVELRVLELVDWLAGRLGRRAGRRRAGRAGRAALALALARDQLGLLLEVTMLMQLALALCLGLALALALGLLLLERVLVRQGHLMMRRRIVLA